MARSLEAAFKAYVALSFWPLVAFMVALACDVAFVRTGDPAWYAGALGAIALGLVGGLIAGLPGSYYFVRAVPRRDTDGSKLASVLMVLNIAVLSLFAFNLALRLVLGPEIPWAVWLGTYLTVFGAVELAASVLVAGNLWRRRQKRIRVAMLRGEQTVESSRRR